MDSVRNRASVAPGYAFELCAMVFSCRLRLARQSRGRGSSPAGSGSPAAAQAITWAVKGTLLSRSIFLAVAGAVAIVLAPALNRLLPEDRE